MVKNCENLRMWVVPRISVLGNWLDHKIYRWVDPAGRPTTPPLDSMEAMEQKADERKVGTPDFTIVCIVAY